MSIRRRCVTASVLTALLCLLGYTPAGAQAQPYAAIDAYIRQHMLQTGTPGLSYAVVGPHGPLHQRWWGVDGHGEPVTAHTPFLWGSVAKPVTATAIMTLVQAGRLRLDQPVTSYLPGFRFGGPAHASKITIRHLLGHTSGIPSSATFEVTDCYDPDCPRPAGRLQALHDVQPLGPPGTTYAYTSANYVVLAAVVEAVTERSFGTYLRKAVLNPAGMDRSIMDTASARKHGLPPGHQPYWGTPFATAGGYDPHGASYGYLGGDLGDLAAFAALQLRSGTPAGAGDVLTARSTRLMRQPGRLQPDDTPTGYGLGWRVGGLDAPLEDAIWHTGATPGYSAMLFLLPERDIALVIQQNLYSVLQDSSIISVGFGAARILAGAEPTAIPSAGPYHWTVWGITGVAAGLILAAARSLIVLRRERRSLSWLRRSATTAAWVALGATPWIAAVPLLAWMGPTQLMTWVPDAAIALGVATIAGTATIALRLTIAYRDTRSTTRAQSHPPIPDRRDGV